MDADCVRHHLPSSTAGASRSFRLDAATLAFYGQCRRADKGGTMIFDRRNSLPVPLLLIAASVLAGCGGSDVAGGASSGLTCVDDSADCIERRQRTLRYLVDDKDRAWIKAQPAPEAYASGVRLFALKSKKKELTCEELAHARNEADKAPGVLRGPSGANLTPAQISRGVMLAGEVSRELASEMKRRCKKG
jgi:hypothetical protein